MSGNKSEEASLPAPDKLVSPGSRRTWVKVLLSLVIFCSGAVAGTCGTLLIIRQQVQHRIHHPEEMPSLMASRIQWVFDLSDEKATQVESILKERQQAIQKIRRDFQPRLDGELDQLEKQIAGVLDQSQGDAWQEWFQEMRARWIPAAP